MDFSTVVVLLLFLLFVMAVVSLVIWTLRNGIAPMPTSPKAKRDLFSLLPHPIEGPIYELGSGWGSLAFPLAKHYPKATIYAFETSPIPFWFSRGWLALLPLPNLHLIRKDFFSVSLSDADLIVCYLYPGAMRHLKTKFETELKPGAWVISNTFAIPGWTPIETRLSNDLYQTKVYLYQKQQESGGGLHAH